MRIKNVAFFYSNSKKNHIQCLKKGNGWAISHEGKAVVIQTHFARTMVSRA